MFKIKYYRKGLVSLQQLLIYDKKIDTVNIFSEPKGTYRQSKYVNSFSYHGSPSVGRGGGGVECSSILIAR